MILKFFKPQKKQVRTRIAPSPTGPLHVGTARTALFNYLFARQKRGTFILRVEDTDKERSDIRFEQDIIEGLKWLTLEHDEFYRQSERTNIYNKYIKKFLKEKKAFYCFHTHEELAEEKNKQLAAKIPLRHVCGHKEQKNQRKTSGGIIRLKGTGKKIKFKDLIRGDIEYDGSLLGDIVIAKNEESPLYNMAVVIDDFEMKISHVIRGEDHIPNTPKQILALNALNTQAPLYAHIPLILGTDRSKLSKRHNATSINSYKKNGYLPEAFLNFMALLGWNPGDNREIFSKNELIKSFSLEKIQKGGAVFNLDKLNWFNKKYIQSFPADKLSTALTDYMPEEWIKTIKNKQDSWEKIINLEKPRLTTLSEIKEGIEYFFDKINYPKTLLVWKDEDLNHTAEYLDNIINLLSGIEGPDFTIGNIKNTIWNFAEEKGRGNVLWPFRVALTGKAKSPEPFSIAEILGKKETLERLKYAKNIIYGEV